MDAKIQIFKNSCNEKMYLSYEQPKEISKQIYERTLYFLTFTHMKYTKAFAALLGILTFASLLVPVASASTTTTGSYTTSATTESHVKGTEKGNHPAYNLTVTAISGTTITATSKAGKTYTVDTTSATMIRKLGAKSSIDQVSVGDKLIVKGTLGTDGTTITATKIRNMSIFKFDGSIHSKIVTVGSDSLTLKDGYTVTVTSATVFKGTKKITVSGLADLKIGDVIKVAGLKDTATKTDVADTIRLIKRATK
jgi:hypothetical protein